MDGTPADKHTRVVTSLPGCATPVHLERHRKSYNHHRLLLPTVYVVSFL